MSVLPLRTWTRSEFRLAAEAGVFGPDERLELLDGQIVRKMTQNAPHVTSLHLISDWLSGSLPVGYSVRLQSPVALSDQSQPEPDISVVLGTRRDYAEDHPAGPKIALLVEVSDSSYRADRRNKSALYAAELIPVLWIVDIINRRIIVHQDPEGGEYSLVHILKAGEEIRSPLGGDPILIAELLP